MFRFVERLQDEPWSRYRAKLLGGQDHWREHLGWGPAEYLAAAEIDALQMNTVVTAYHGSRKRPKAPDPFYRPEGERPTAAKSLDDVDTDALESMINR